MLKNFVSRKVNESEKKEILNLFKKGTNIKEISKIYNFTIPTITRQLKTLMGDREFLKFKNSNLKGTDSENKKFKSLKRIYKVFSELPNTNFFNKYLNTFNWIIHNSIQRIFSKNYKDKEKLEFLYSILLD